MQYHLNGFRPGDPHVQPTTDEIANRPKDKVDVLIVGTGPAGLTLAAQLAQFSDINTRIVEQRAGPLELGQADGVACRSIEMFEAFGFSERVLKESYWVNETTFWGPSGDEAGTITRTGRIQDVADDLSEMPHVILSQARLHDFYLETMRNSAVRLEPDYSTAFAGLSVDPAAEYPVAVTLTQGETTEIVQARYVVGCDGARSAVRQALGKKLIGEAANKAWGVMDVFVDTDFPDIRFKSVVRSANEGNLLIIPREGGYLVRLYVEMETLAQGVRVKDRNIALEDLAQAARRILHPYRFDVKETVWWSVYEIGQRLCSDFDNGASETPPTVFIAGDACHTHSPKAGQGMNVSMGDTFNLGWNLAAVLRGQSSPSLLRTYSDERQAIAQELIDFDRHWAAEFATSESGQTDRDVRRFQDYFAQHGRYTAGVAVTYAPSILCKDHGCQKLAKGFGLGTRFHSAPVIRIWDARPLQLGHCLKADGRWRLVLFNDTSDPADTGSRLWHMCEQLQNHEASPLKLYRSQIADIDHAIDLRAVFQQSYRLIEAENTHPLLTPKKGRLALFDREKMFSPDPGFDIYDRRFVDREKGCAIILRPDQYVAAVLPLDGFDMVADFFAGVLRRFEQP